MTFTALDTGGDNVIPLTSAIEEELLLSIVVIFNPILFRLIFNIFKLIAFLKTEVDKLHDVVSFVR